MISLRKRGGKYHVDMNIDGVRLRGPVGTRSYDVARKLTHRLETALAEGKDSAIWRELERQLPCPTYQRFSDHAGVKLSALPTWSALRAAYNVFSDQRIALGKLAASTAERYEFTYKEFDSFLSGEELSLLQDINKAVVERFKVWRIERIKKKNFSRGASSLSLDAAILHRIFAFALENEMIVRNPVRTEGRPGENPTNGAEPFSADELFKLREHADGDLLALLVLRHTGFRGSDAVRLTWQEVLLDSKEIKRITKKRKKGVIIPTHTELQFAFEAEHGRQKPKSTDRVLVNPYTGEPMTRPGLYRRMLALGKRAGVPHAHPHRFRDTFAVDMLAKGASPYDVAKMLGDTIETIERHYTPFVKELRERVRNILETGVGIEEAAKIASLPRQNPPQKPN